MRKWTLLFVVLFLGLSACQGASEHPEIIEIAAALPETSPPQDILGKWVLDQNHSTFGDSLWIN